MTSTAMQMRAWRGTALLSYGFRPFFLGGAAWAAFAMVLWLPMLTGHIVLPTAFDPVSWHAHAFLYGYLGAVVAGFMLTAVPNWTGRLPIVGWRLGILALTWLAGRVAVAFSAGLPPGLVAMIDLAFPVVFALAVGREIVAGKNWRNLIVLGMLTVFIAGNAVFHWEAARGDYAAGGTGLRIGLGAALMMIAVIGGRIIPSFTRNWLAKRKPGRLPVPPMQRFDKLTLVVLLVSLLLWVVLPVSPWTGVALVACGVLHLGRLARWAGDRTLTEPLVAVLHVGYSFLPLGALFLGVTILLEDDPVRTASQHLWMGGALGLMTLAVMTRATLGHTGRPLHAGAATLAVYAALVGSVLARFAAGFWPDAATLLHGASAGLWLAAFAGYAAAYGPSLCRRPPGKAG
ncbi:NnrS family protein [Stappia sp. ES.058]|uniref:NnrS family protein n=1 Tax=Stappia sp. ES.058 TaxID=1881061 RepID=UPI00087C5ECF|nr:NnrS family protein [Stappia sp. ES.058]SDU04320.1 uncharacterized protein involved in response to NO [Stappia sp. ES.058]